jgi:hypothetical protein
MMMEAVRTSETSVDNHFTRQYNPEDSSEQHVHKMEDNRLPKELLNYHPKGRRRPGRPLKRLLDDMTAETDTDHPSLNS